MKITINNYEAYFLDYREGQLNPEQLSELGLFLSLHPELKCKLELSDIITLKSENYNFKNKNLLKKLNFESVAVCESNFDDFCIAYHENLLSHEKSQELIQFSHTKNTYDNDLKIYGKTNLKPQFNLQFPHKRQLYHKVVRANFIGTYLFRIGSIAAGIALIIGLFLVTNQKNSKKFAHITQKPSAQKENAIAFSKQEELKSKKISKANVIRIKPTQEIIDTSSRFVPAGIKRQEQSLALLAVPKIKLIENTVNPKIKTYEPTEEATAIGENTSKLDVTLENALEKLKKEVTNLSGLKDNKGNFSLVKVIKAGVTGINKMTESNMTLTETTDSTGKGTIYSFNSDIIKFQKHLRN
jgi:hypothetical protein